MLHQDDPFCCIDLDVKPDTAPDDRARFESIIATMDSYTERSRSGLGWHVWVKAGIGTGRRRDGVEVYSQERFMICTGDVVHPVPIAERQNVIDSMISQMARPAPEIDLTGPDTPDLAAAARAEADKGEMGRLWQGDWRGRYDSKSEADLALVKFLLPLTASPRESWATFRLSALGQRDKAARADYARRTIAVATQHLERDAYHIRHGRKVWEALCRNMKGGPVALRPVGSRLRLLRDNDLDALPPLRWLVKGVIPDAGIGAIYGASGTYKSFLSLDLLAHVSNGKEWFGHRVKAAPAVYVPFEGQGGVPKRIRAWRQVQSAERHPERVGTFEPDPDVLSHVAVIMEPLNLLDPNDRDRLVATLTEEGLAGGLLEIDTLAQAASGIEENSSEMGKMLAIFRDLQQRLGGVILLVHHSGKDESRGMRGWSGLHAAMDFVIECRSRGEPGTRLAEFSLAKVKDDATGAAHAFRLDVVPLGPDEDGDPVTSLVVREVEPAEEPDHPFKTDKAGTDAETAAKDNDFIANWARTQVLAGKYPSRNGLKNQLGEMKDTGYEITQVRVLAAIDRLLDACRLVREPKSPNGNQWLRPQDVDVGGSPA